MEDQVCPRCRTTKYRNPSLKLLVNVCGHSLCESCVDLLFLKGSGSCPECQIPLRRSNFRVQLFEDPAVEKEVDIRKKVLRDYNKKEEDFSTLAAYNDYLEEIEDIIFNLVNGIDVLETNRRIEQYKRDNKDSILKNRVKIGRCESELEEMLEMEKAAGERRRTDAIREEVEVKRKKARAKEALIDELMFSEGNAKSIVESFVSAVNEECGRGEAAEAVRGNGADHKSGPTRATQFSTGIRIGKSQEFYLPGSGARVEEVAPLYKPTDSCDLSCDLITTADRWRIAETGSDPELTAGDDRPGYEEPQSETEGPQAPDWAEAVVGGPSTEEHIRKETDEEKAGGFHMREACLRAIREAVAGLYYSARERGTTADQ